ncbi:lysophospholipid acyltransferase family protein [Selenihalanaerobacter shriftii]|uniref:lysophospholipid acyltransferase family protein n=1 Tax=Selenihalanaerobacter shriftii TaxID=142842 RepID=UPI00117B3132|nr:lysophospholipid acyltransferase family protein [Selenihalanaerobacter shriftii]
MKDIIIYMLYRLLEIVVNLVPEPLAYFIGKRFGDLVYILLKTRRQIAIKNLKLALEVDDVEADQLTKANFRHLGMVLIEFLRLSQLTEENVDEVIEIEGIEHLKEAQQQKEGFVLFTGHFGNWELLGAALALKGFSINALARDQGIELINDHILRTREEKGIDIFSNKGMVVKKAYRVLQQGEGLFMLGDQKSRHSDHYTEFFGLKARVELGPVALAARTNSTIIPVYIARQEIGKHKIFIREPVKVKRNITEEETNKKIRELTATLEDIIREYPTQWLWAHNRWKYSPDLRNN